MVGFIGFKTFSQCEMYIGTSFAGVQNQPFFRVHFLPRDFPFFLSRFRLASSRIIWFGGSDSNYIYATKISDQGGGRAE